MLPTVPLSNTRLTVDDLPQPVRSTTQVLDTLSEFIPGQKLIAQIQFQLANGAYRATIAQRDVTLALPFSAKAGDSLELEVVETEGRLAFAVAKGSADTAKEGGPQLSASTTLSRTGQLIAQLMREGESGQQSPSRLNGNEPLLPAPTTSAREIAPALQQAVQRSGMFYESHQAAWVAGRLPTAELRQEPQARLFIAQGDTPGSPGTPAPNQASAPGPSASPLPAGTASQTGPTPLHKDAVAVGNPPPATGTSEATTTTGTTTSASTKAATGLPGELAPLVQQQLSGLANNVYPFQGALWPGQQIHWEIVDEDGGRESTGQDEAPRQWKTRLKLLLPSLGDIDASVQLDGNDVVVQMKASQATTQNTLKQGAEALRNRLDLAGLRLTGLDVKGYEGEGGDGRAG